MVVVDVLEAVDIDAGQRELAVVAVCTLDRSMQAVVEQDAVRQAGQGVMVGLMAHHRLHQLALGDLLGQLLVALGQLVQRVLQLGARRVQLQEHAHLRLQDHVVDRLGYVIHRAGAVTLEPVHVVGVGGGDEDDRGVAQVLGFAQQGGHLEAVHVGHVDVEQDQREFVVQAQRQRLVAAARLEQLRAAAGEQSAHGDQVRGGIVDDQDFRWHRVHVGDEAVVPAPP